MSTMEDVPPHARLSATGRVKNKAPAKVQLTAEQLLREAWERKESGPSAAPKQQISDLEELQEYQRTERKQFEMRIVRNRGHTPLWQRYARWEESQDDLPRARSIWERAVDNDYRNPAIWLGYSEMEMRHRFVNHARNIFDRAVALLPRVDQLWLKYAHMEELLGQVDLARLVYSRWLKWLPGVSAFFAAIRLELRLGDATRARAIYEDMLRAHRTAHCYIKFAKFEERQEQYTRARVIYERATAELAEVHLTSGFFLSFAKFEERRKQPERARVIYNYALSKLPREESGDLHRAFTTFEKHQGDREILDDLLVRKKRGEYIAALAQNARDYDTWFDLLQLEERHSSDDQIRQAYERAITNTPPSSTKLAWRRYIYLWISYAAWAELSGMGPSTAVRLYKRCIATIPNKHGSFSFGKLWVLYAQAHVRNGDVGAARQALGAGIGVLPNKERLYRAYVDLEMGLGEVGRARNVYQTWLERTGGRSDVWLELAQLEESLGETRRAVGVLRVAVGVGGAGGSHAVWERLVEVLSAAGGGDAEIRSTFEAFVERCADARAWVQFAQWESERGGGTSVFERAVTRLRGSVVEGGAYREVFAGELEKVVTAWAEWEEGRGGEDVERVRAMMPKRVRRSDGEGWSFVLADEGGDGGGGGKEWLLEAARKWKLKRVGNGL